MTTIKLRRGTAEEWSIIDPILADGEPGFEMDTGNTKIGDGATNWTGLDYHIPKGEILALINAAVENVSGATTIDGVEGLTAALADKADDTEITAINLALTELDNDKAAKAAITGGTNAGVVITYDATNDVYDFTIPDRAPPIVRFAAEIATVGITGTDRAYVARTISEAHMRVGSAPVGSALTVAVQTWSGTGASWVTLTTLTIPAGSLISVSAVDLNFVQAVGAQLRLNVTSVGSTTPAGDVVVDVVFA